MRHPPIGLAAGLGLFTFKDASGSMWFKGGHNDSTGNMVVGREAGRRSVVLPVNCARAELADPDPVRFVLGDTAMPWSWACHHE